MLDVFKGDAFNTLSLTTAINMLPFKPKRLGQMGLFTRKGIDTLDVAIEWRENKLSLLTNQARGTMPTTQSDPNRKVKSFRIFHLPFNDALVADEVQNVRVFGSEDAVEGVTEKVNDKLQRCKDNHEATHEFHRCGALRGVITDGDGSTVLLNLFTEFGISETNVNFDFTPGTQDMKLQCLSIIRSMEDALGADTYDHIHCMCSTGFFDAFISHATVASAFERYLDNQFAREVEPQRKGFKYADIIFEEYRGKIGSTDFIPANTARFFPVGVPELFMEWFGPADFVEAVNTIGKPYYAKQEPMKFDKGIEIHTQSNPLIMPTRPKCLIKGTKV